MTEALRREIWKREISLYSWNGKIIKIPIPYVSSRYFVVKLKKPYTREMSMECYCLSIFFFFQSGVSLNRKQQQQLVCSVEVRLEFFLKKLFVMMGHSWCQNQIKVFTVFWAEQWNISIWYSLAVLLRCRLKSDFDSNAEPLNFQAKFIDYYSVIWSSFLGIVVHTTVMGS